MCLDCEGGQWGSGGLEAKPGTTYTTDDLPRAVDDGDGLSDAHGEDSTRGGEGVQCAVEDSTTDAAAQAGNSRSTSRRRSKSTNARTPQVGSSTTLYPLP